MPTAHHARQRSPPPNVKKTAVRAPGPSALTRKPSSAKLANKGGRDKVGPTEECIDRDEDDDMATGFLQFWYLTINKATQLADFINRNQCHVRETDCRSRQHDSLLFSKVDES